MPCHSRSRSGLRCRHGIVLEHRNVRLEWGRLVTFERLMIDAGLTARPAQQSLAEQVEAHLGGGLPKVVAVQAATGIGKTWALAHPATVALRNGRRVVWSTHTILLRNQVLLTMRQALAAAWPDERGRPVLAERRGRADYVSAVRTRRLRHFVADNKGPAESIATLDALADWAGTIAEFNSSFGELPVPASLVCLTPTSPSVEQVAYIAQRDAAASAHVVVQTHALTLVEARFKRLAGDLIIFDEADTLPSVAASSVEVRLPLADLEALDGTAEVGMSESIARLSSKAGDGDGIVWRDAEMVDDVCAIAAACRMAARSAAPEIGLALADTADDLEQFAAVNQLNTGAALVADRTAGPILAVASVDPAAWLGSALADRQVVLMSATLGRHEEDDLAPFCRGLGFWQVEKVDLSLERFGEMGFRLADRSVPAPFGADGVPDARFYDYAAAMVREAAVSGRTLVLCASYSDADQLASRLGDTAVIQMRGQRLGPLVDRFRQSTGGILVTPAAWAGLDLPYIVDNVVIVRLPIGRPDELREAVLTGALRRRGRSDVDARAVLANQARGDAMRRLGQGIGRGIRADDDRCTVWIADPRFPLPANLETDLRRRLSQGLAEGWRELAKVIPRRFREGGARSPFGRAIVVAAKLSVEAA
jgi:ATP-dependent DNA helicase DinG